MGVSIGEAACCVAVFDERDGIMIFVIVRYDGHIRSRFRVSCGLVR